MAQAQVKERHFTRGRGERRRSSEVAGRALHAHAMGALHLFGTRQMHALGTYVQVLTLCCISPQICTVTSAELTAAAAGTDNLLNL